MILRNRSVCTFQTYLCVAIPCLPSAGQRMLLETAGAQASKLRQLVRIKLEDKNDLKAAESALVHCRNFFTDANAAAKDESTTLLELMNRPLP